jgi:hypothetical protein
MTRSAANPGLTHSWTRPPCTQPIDPGLRWDGGDDGPVSLPPKNGAAAASSYDDPDQSDQGQGPALATGPGTVSTAGFASAFLAE